MGQRVQCISGTSNWSERGYIHWCVITSKNQDRLASKLDTTLGCHNFGLDQTTERWEGLQAGYWRDQEAQGNYWGGCWVHWETHLHVCACIYLPDRQSVWLGEVHEGILFLCVCIHMQLDFFSRNWSVAAGLSDSHAKMPATAEKEDIRAGWMSKSSYRRDPLTDLHPKLP